MSGSLANPSNLNLAFAVSLSIVSLCLLALLSFMLTNFEPLAAWLGPCTIFQNALAWISLHVGFARKCMWLGAHTHAPTIVLALLIVLAAAVAASLLLAVLNIYAANCLKKQKHYQFTFFLSCINCLCGPLGLVQGITTIRHLRRPEVIAIYMLPTMAVANSIETALEHGALIEIIRMPNPFHVGLVLTYWKKGSDHAKERTVWINGWFGISLPISIKAIVTRRSPYLLPFLPSAGPFIINRATAEQIERMARSVEKHMNENLVPYSFVPGVFDGIWPLFAAGGYTS